MTQKEKIGRAIQFAHLMKNTAHSIEYDANDYDTKWPLSHTSTIIREAERLLDDLTDKKKTVRAKRKSPSKTPSRPVRGGK